MFMDCAAFQSHSYTQWFDAHLTPLGPVYQVCAGGAFSPSADIACVSVGNGSTRENQK